MVANRHDGDLAGSGSSIRGRWRFRPWRAKATAAAAAGERLYRTIVEQARNPEFYQQWEVPDTPDGRFDMIALHAILVLRRMRDDATAANTAQALFDRMFVDFDESLREMGVGDLRVGKQVKAMAKGVYGRIVAYGDALDRKDQAGLAEALRRNVYRSAVPVDDSVARLASYMQREADSLAGTDITALLAGTFRFLPPSS
ncbi:MAG: ubiquinol-cytochrome C chaperone family protein [Rhodospirillales bacterium]